MKIRNRGVKAPPSILPPGVNALLSTAQVCAALSIGQTCFRRMVAAGEFPESESPPGKDPRWKLSTVNQWIDAHYVTRGA